jgi:signal transduction histidine kinase
MIGKNPSLWGGLMPKEYYQKLWKTIRDEKRYFSGEINNKRKSGELYEAEIRVSPILDEKGELLFYVGIERDLSKDRAVERAKTEFISLASHQLRTPLSAVKWFSEMLVNGDAGKLTELQKKFVHKIVESNEREIQLVNSLLNVSRIESGKIVLVPKMTDLRKLVETTISEFKVGLVEENKTLTLSVSKDIPLVYIDPDLIRQVYSNLISNSIKYSKAGGVISVKITMKGNKVVSEVKDNGIGIPKHEQERIFEKFFRGSNALKKNTEGNGLGLYLIKTILESSGGNIWFTSSENKGTSFTFTLPVRSPKSKVKIKKPTG